jgi:hypothetical protein
MTKDLIVQRIRELAASRGGHVSFDTFISETGIKDKWLRGQDWFSGWNSLLLELGLKTRSFGVARTPQPHIAKAVAEWIMRHGRWPTEDDLRRERKRNSSFPSLKVISPIRRSGELAALIVALGKDGLHLSDAVAIATKHLRPNSTGSETLPDERIRGYVYLLRSGRRYKIGKSADPSRRYREVRLELPDETHQVHTIPTDDPSGIEAYWHARFAEKRVRNTEFFELDGSDVQAFKRRKYQ